MRKSSISLRALIVSLAAGAPAAAYAANRCPNVVTSEHAFAGAGENCTAPAGAYLPTPTGATILPFTDPGYGFVTYNGGQLTTAGAVTITPGQDDFDVFGSGGALSRGAGSLLTMTNGATINTTAANAVGVQADGGGGVVIGAVGVATSIATTGANAFDAYATGVGSLITATDVAASYASQNTTAVWADQSAKINWTGGSITASGRFAINAQASNSATLTLSGAALLASGNGAQTIFATNGGRVGASNMILTSTGGVDTATGLPAGVASNNAFNPSSTTGGILNISGSTLSATGLGAYGVYTADGGITALTNDSITIGAQGGAAIISAAGGTTHVIGGSARTDGADTAVASAYGGGAIGATGASFTATGLGSSGVTVAGANSGFTGANLAILVQGGFDSATGFHANGISNQTFGSYLGGGTVHLTNSTLILTGNYGVGVYNANGGAVTMTDGAINTSGLVSDGFYAASGSTNNLSGVAITTTGAGAKGLSVHDAGTTLNGSNLTVVTSGATASGGYQADALYNGNGGGPGAGSTGGATVSLTASSFSTHGDHANGVVTENGGSTTLTQSSVATSGVQASAVYGSSGSATTLSNVTLTTTGNAAKGIDIEGSDTRLQGSNITITTSGTIDPATGFHAQGVYNGSSVPPAAGRTGGGTVTLIDSGVTTHGDLAYGVDTADGGMTSYSGGSIATSGVGAIALLATSAATTFVTPDSDGQGAAISTTGRSAIGVFAGSGGSITLTGAAISTHGAGSNGLVVRDSGSSVTATNVTIATQGGVDAVTGAHANGVYNGPGSSGTSGGLVTLTNAAISTAGVNAFGVDTATGGTTHVNGGSITTSNTGAIGVFAFAGGVVTVAGTNVSTGGASADAVVANGGGGVTIAGAKVITTGAGSSGLVVVDATSSLTATNVTVSTSGGIDTSGNFHAHGAYNGPSPTGTSGGMMTLNNVTIATSGNQSNGVVTAAGGQTTINGGSVTTTGAGGIRLLADGANAVISATNVAVSTSGNLFGQDVVAADGGIVTMTGGSANTTGQGSYAVGVASDGSASLTGVTITTTGLGSGGVAINGSTAKFTGDHLTISVKGGFDAADQFNAIGVFNGSFQSFTGGGAVKLTDSTLVVGGAKGYGVLNSSSGSMTILGGSITTTGAQTPGVASQNGAVTTIGLDAGGQATAVLTSGASSAAALASAGGALSLTGATLTTTGDGSVGLAVNDAGSSATATNVTISTKGSVDSATGFNAIGVYNGPGPNGTSGGNLTLANVTVTTQGDRADAFSTDAGGTSKTTGGAFSTSGAGATAVSVLNSGALTISGAALTTTGEGASGLIINGTGGVVTASNLTINTSGGVWSVNGSHADGVYNGAFGGISGGGVMQIADSSVTTSGAQAYGVSVGAGGTTVFLGGSIATSGTDANAARANGGSLTIGLDPQGKGAAISTSGPGAYAAVAVGGGKVALTGATIATTGDGSGGLGVNGAGSEIDATGLKISTQGGIDPVSGLHAYGAANSPHGSFATGGVLKLTDVAISTAGVAMYGVYTGAGSTTTFAGGSVATSGDGAVGLYTTGAGGSLTTANLTVSTSGAGASGAYVTSGGALTLGQDTQISTTGLPSVALYVGAGSTATVNGQVGLNASGSGATGAIVDGGGALTVNGALTIKSANIGVFNSGAVNVPGALSLTTTAAGAAISNFGDGANFRGTGGGVINSASLGVVFLDGAGQSATFTNYSIQTAGDLIFADPASATVAFDNSLANAGAGNLAHVVGGSDLTLTALASTLIGAVVTDSGSSSTITLSGGSVWTITGNSTATNLNLVNSFATFGPPTGGFHTLTVNSYSGSNAFLTFNAALGGANPGADQLIINGGQATGTTLIGVRPINLASARTIGAASPPVAASPSPGVPIVVTTNGGTIAPNAFALAGPLVVGGTVYTLQQQPGGEFLVGSQGQSSSQLSGSLNTLSQSRQSQAITSRVLGSILTGATEQINCSSCSSGFASFGSFALGVHGRWTLSPSVALIAGISYDNFTGKGVSVNNALLGALGVRYDMVQLGKYRPFFETGVAVSPYANVTFRRSYLSSLGSGVGVGNTLSRSVAAFARAGYIWRLSSRDEAALYTDLTRSWQSTGGYLESANPGNPFGALVAPSLDTMNIWKVGGQFTHLFGDHIEANVSAGYAVAFDAKYSSTASLAGLSAAGAAAAGLDWAELGGRLSYRFSKNLIADAFVLGTLGAEPAGSQIHGGLALRMAF